MMIATDGVTVQPLVFPGGDLGRLAAHGTVNDLSVAGAVPHWLTLGLILEEGLPVATLRRLVTSFGQAVEAAGARVLAGDTKVVPRGQGGGVYATVTGLGPLVRPGLGVAAIRPGDAVLVSGPVGDHGTAVMLAREDFQISGDLVSDCASVAGLCRTAWRLDGLRFLRDPTRGGLATTGHEIVRDRGLGLTLDAATIPIRPAVASVCAMLGLDPLYLACEGRVVAVIAADQADALLADWRGRGDGAQAARIGTVTGGPARLSLTTPIGGTRLLEPLEDDPLPRIC
ncbi:hydrogenase expression/formation protein HypE [Rhodothalassium salexigens]|nr:hydrogenase expression/formation protein HypE [Rhodothalassium salexigens]MBK5919468.1 hydrogenase expression/formation protein HypE [Rhodothalassium salexigens]